jgi:glyoxalase family protein
LQSPISNPQSVGIHHVTAIAGDPQENVDFYNGLLGLRLVKRSVNQDDPGTYHLFYADGAGHPGSDLTFFPWPHLPPGKVGAGITTEVAFAVPVGTLDFWEKRLGGAGAKLGTREERFGERVLPCADPHGLPLAFVETTDDHEFTPWGESPVPEASQIRRIHAVRLWERVLAPTAVVLQDVLGFAPVGDDGDWKRFGPPGGGSGRWVDVRETPDAPPGRMGRGSVHHVAYRVADEETQRRVRARVDAARLRPTPVIDRFWFRSVYFLEPGGVLFELATDGPGFAVDEDSAHLGERLVLPPWLEPERAKIEAALPEIRTRRIGG